MVKGTQNLSCVTTYADGAIAAAAEIALGILKPYSQLVQQ